ncbi:hypothetical protein GmHk_06G017149 [Glycine max]|nr:hypothetical protein GmHk_06G017149 [Glycine max]
MAKKRNQPQVVQAALDFRSNPSSTSSEDAYKNEDIGGYFARRVLSIQVKLTVETISQAISFGRQRTKSMNSWGDELEDHIGHSLSRPAGLRPQGDMDYY